MLENVQNTFFFFLPLFSLKGKLSLFHPLFAVGTRVCSPNVLLSRSVVPGGMEACGDMVALLRAPSSQSPAAFLNSWTSTTEDQQADGSALGGMALPLADGSQPLCAFPSA